MSSIYKKSPDSHQSNVNKRHVLTLEERVAVLKYLDSHPNASMDEVCLRFSSNPRTLRRIQDKRETLLNLPAGDKRLSRTRFTKGNCLPVEFCVLRWMDLAHFNKLNVTNHTLQNRAKYFFSLVKNYLPQVPFLAASNGWINRFKVRNSIDLKDLNRESSSYFSQELAPKRVAIQNTLSKYSLEDVFVLSTTVLFYSFLPTLSNPVPRGSNPQLPPSERISLFLCSNASGKEKLFPSVVVPSSSIMEGSEDIHVSLFSNASGRIDSDSCHYWLESFHRYVNGRRVALVLDYTFSLYFSALSVTSLYPNLELVFLPQRHSLALQPFNLGITDVFKTEYRVCLAKTAFEHCSGGSEEDFVSFNITQPRAIALIEKAWSALAPSAIQLSWKASGLLPSHLVQEISELDLTLPDPIHSFLSLHPQLYSVFVNFNACDRINLDRDGSFPTEAEILIVEEAVSWLLDAQSSVPDVKLFQVPITPTEDFCPGQMIPRYDFDQNYTRDTHEFPFNDISYFPVFTPLPNPTINEEYQPPYMMEEHNTFPREPSHFNGAETQSLISRNIQIQNVDMLLGLLRNQLCSSFDAPENITAALDLISQYVHRHDQ
ncbi:hypothetical protein DSO57_1039703 [Entomophthora muscae]|uniref:Uncharacterized protein n=1 Tax=Entomophthora muscae TaxID=34485 RepID=A0ACC2RQY6_9FUNG|nr:hypothetical protein DSO57_1039703 [Entomophthora muscae]